MLAACQTSELTSPTESTIEQQLDACPVGPMLKGIDVSKYEMTIDWPAVKADGVVYAFVRVSDGTMFPDQTFDANWAGSRAVGIKHGAYQYFRANEDPIAQADMLLAKIGSTIADDDLPPVADVEADNGQSPETIRDNLRMWSEHVAEVTGRDPMIYTDRVFWRDKVASANFTESPLWHAQYSTAPCANIPDPWQTWMFWQYTDSGTVAGITVPVDIDRFNGDEIAFEHFLGPFGSEDSICGDDRCTAGEDASNCPWDCPPCGYISADGGTIDDGDACFEPGGPVRSLRHVTTAGEGEDLLWTHATDHLDEGNFATWHLFLQHAGRYQVDVYTDAAFAQSKAAKYVIQANVTSTEKVIDQTAVNGWQSLGEFEFDEGGYQSIHLGDNTGEPPAMNVQVVFDAVRLTPIHASDGGAADGEGVGSSHHGGCNVGSDSGLSLVAAAAALTRRRRARPPQRPNNQHAQSHR
jgi:lysozyme